MTTSQPLAAALSSPAAGSPADRPLEPAEERALLRELVACRAELDAALAVVPGFQEAGGDDPQARSRRLAAFYADAARDGADHARLGAVDRRYRALRSRLAMANIGLVGHLARRYRRRGLAFSDLMQEGFCGLLEAIDRFDPTYETKLATYAAWWILQAIQQAVAAGAYPVRLLPRHLRLLARSQEALAGTGPAPGAVRQILAATRPSVSLDSARARAARGAPLEARRDPERDRAGDVDTDEAVGRLLGALGPREREVLALRFGLGGRMPLSLSQVGRCLSVSKQRVRQIEERALARLRAAARTGGLAKAVGAAS